MPPQNKMKTVITTLKNEKMKNNNLIVNNLSGYT